MMETGTASPGAGYILVVTMDAAAAPTALFFSGLVPLRPALIRVAQYRRDAMPALVGGASAIVFVRGLFEFRDLVECAGRLGIPRYYFLDDHFILIREQGGAAAAFAQQHSEANVAAMLQGFAGVLASTAALAADYRRRGVHTRFQLLPPMAGAAVARQDAGSIRIAFFGGVHLHGIFGRVILPAVRRLARTRRVTLITVGVPAGDARSEGLHVIALPYEPSYHAGVAKLAEEGVDVLAHPVAPGLPSNPFKNPHALITANTLGAIPVVSDAEPYAGLRPADVAVLCHDSEGGWYEGLQAAIDSGAAGARRARLREYCDRHYSGAINQQVCRQILAEHAAPSPLTALMRTAASSAWLAASWCGRGVNRVIGRQAAVAA